MFTRRYGLPTHTFLLFGPRGTGKTTWLKQVLPDVLWFDLLRTQVVLDLIRQPESFRQQVEALPRGRWVVVDEVQRMPALLNDVQALLGGHGNASFARFLEVAALVNGQVVNVAGIARDAAVARPTVQGYFSTLEDTLVGVWLPAWRKRAKVKEVAGRKFYLFDSGVARALAGRLREPLDGLERGFLLETWILHELRAAMAALNVGGQLHYWRTPSGTEVDFIWTRAGRAVGIEVKAASTWRSGFGTALKGLVAQGTLAAAHGVYTGGAERKDGPLRIWPIASFLRQLTKGNIVG